MRINYSSDKLKETREFIRFLKKLDEKQQIGLNLAIEGMRLLSEKTKKAVKNR